MPVIRVERRFNAKLADVFCAFTALESAPERITAIQKLEVLTDGPMQVGTRFRETRVMFGKEATEEMEVTRFSPNEGYTVEAESCGTHYTTSYAFADKGESTEVVMSFEGRPLTFFGKVMSVVFRPFLGMMTKMVAKDMDDLGAYLEGPGGDVGAADGVTA